MCCETTTFPSTKYYIFDVFSQKKIITEYIFPHINVDLVNTNESLENCSPKKCTEKCIYTIFISFTKKKYEKKSTY